MTNVNFEYNMLMGIRELIERVCKKHGITQETLAKLLGVAPETIVRWKKGACEPHKNHIEKLIEMLMDGVDPLSRVLTAGAKLFDFYLTLKVIKDMQGKDTKKLVSVARSQWDEVKSSITSFTEDDFEKNVYVNDIKKIAERIDAAMQELEKDADRCLTEVMRLATYMLYYASLYR